MAGTIAGMKLHQTVPWGRSFDEYVRMFAIAECELDLRIVGCGDGPAAFNTEMTRLGKHVTSIDPLYRFSADEIAQRIRDVYGDVVEGVRRKVDSFHWTDFRSPDDLGMKRMESMRLFLADYPSGVEQGRYVEAALPTLPFADRQFDLALCSHFLFTYSDLLNEDDHFDAVREMCRVAREARVFPILNMFDGGRSRHLDGVMRRLREIGFVADLQRVPYEFQRGGNEMLRIVKE